jgi:hypothetical protein
MATPDLAAFAEREFDPKAWVNAACAGRPASAEEPLDRFLAELEMRLQLAAEEIEAGLQESSGQAMRRIPFGGPGCMPHDPGPEAAMLQQ